MAPINLPAPVYNLLRTALQSAWGLLVGHFAVLSVVPADTVVSWVISFVVIGALAGAVHWLETRTGDGFWPKTARWVAKVAMLGLGKSPTYSASTKA
jgi:hypothetical protein